jgi:ribonuclease HII
MSQPIPTLRYEHKRWSRSLTHIAGVDEAGRGAWAGPVVAGAVILPRVQHFIKWNADAVLQALSCARDSKLLSPAQREALVEPIHTCALAYATGQASHEEIDALGIVPATRLAMQRAISGLTLAPDALLVDALARSVSRPPLPAFTLPQTAIIRGDQISLSIACASILAKVTRDRILVELDVDYPGYGFARHKGYGTAVHQAALRTLGASSIHRASFAPIKNLAQALPTQVVVAVKNEF